MISSLKYLSLISFLTIPFTNATDLAPLKSLDSAQKKLTQLESSFGGRIGVYALNTGPFSN
jgi:hypothetical protein